jgi:RNA polymerase sigma-70 factor (ECF subfamily)
MEVELTPLDRPVAADFASLIADRDLLDVALRRLSPERRAVVVLHYFLGMDLPTVAESLGIPVGTVKSRLHRSLAEMRISITGDLEAAVPSAAGGQPA